MTWMRVILCSAVFIGHVTTFAESTFDDDSSAREPAQRGSHRAATSSSSQTAPMPQVMQQDDLFEQLRQLSGRIDVVENQLIQINAAQTGDKDSAGEARRALDQKFLAYEEALKKIETQVQAIEAELSKMKIAAAEKPAPQTAKAGKPEAKSPAKAFEEGEALFKEKKYKEAILAYEKYRGAGAKGRFYAEATYKMGVCFQEVGLKDEARAFFEEVTAKFPGSKEAKKAAARAKQLK